MALTQIFASQKLLLCRDVPRRAVRSVPPCGIAEHPDQKNVGTGREKLHARSNKSPKEGGSFARTFVFPAQRYGQGGQDIKKDELTFKDSVSKANFGHC
jgi:hypothetical protein